MDAVLYVVDLARMTAYYRDALGLDLTGVQDGAADLDCGGATLHLVQVPQHIAAGIEIASPPERREETPIKLVIAVDDLASARSRATALGGSVEPAEREWSWNGTTRVDAVDPEGNVVQLAASP